MTIKLKTATLSEIDQSMVRSFMAMGLSEAEGLIAAGIPKSWLNEVAQGLGLSPSEQDSFDTHNIDLEEAHDKDKK